MKHLPGYTSQRWGMVCILPVFLCPLCCSMYCLRVNEYCTTAIGCQSNCSWIYHITSDRIIITNHISSYHIISNHIIPHHIIAYIISYHIISYHIISYHIISYHIISYHIISYHIMSKRSTVPISGHCPGNCSSATQDRPSGRGSVTFSSPSYLPTPVLQPPRTPPASHCIPLLTIRHGVRRCPVLDETWLHLKWKASFQKQGLRAT